MKKGTLVYWRPKFGPAGRITSAIMRGKSWEYDDFAPEDMLVVQGNSVWSAAWRKVFHLRLGIETVIRVTDLEKVVDHTPKKRSPRTVRRDNPTSS